MDMQVALNIFNKTTIDTGGNMNKPFVFILLLLVMQGIAPAVRADNSAGTLWAEPRTGMEFVWVPAGCFQMGGDEGSYEQPIHKVCVKGFWMGKYEVTQSQYQQVTGKNPSRFPGLKNPVETVSWEDAVNFAEIMTKSTGVKIRLPSEAEWEYACRSGRAQERYCGGNDTQSRFAWFKANSSRQTHPVGSLTPNDWGLYDMSGSVWEWVQDCWHNDFRGAPTDGSVWKSDSCTKRVLRGGSWCNDPSLLRAGFRYGNYPDGGECGGFRVVNPAQ
jgi:formylglycine-generating enzyme required for sulfatase activity